MTIFWHDIDGKIVKATDDSSPMPAGAIGGVYDGDGEAPEDTVAGPAPESGLQTWNGNAWSVAPLPSLDEIYDEIFLNQRVLKALILCLNDGSIVPGADVSGADLKTAIKNKM